MSSLERCLTFEVSFIERFTHEATPSSLQGVTKAHTIKLPKTELNTEAAMAACELWAGSVEGGESGVLPCPSSFLSSTALVRMTADDTGGGMHDTTVSL